MYFPTLRRALAAAAILSLGTALSAQPTTPRPTVFGTHTIAPGTIANTRTLGATRQTPPPAHPRNNIPL